METILKVNNLTISLKDTAIMTNISFEIKSGEAVLLSGANGIGKSTLLKSILCLETEGKRISGEINYAPLGNVLAFDKEKLQMYRSRIVYVQQKDDYSEMGNVLVRDIISDSREASSGKSMSAAEVNDLIDQWIPKRDDNSRVFDAKSKPAKFSGGEQRLLSVLSVIATRSTADLMIIDEPLNNLDFVNARNISNLINRVVKKNPNMGLLMISHCRIFPFITREITLTKDGIIDVAEHYECHSCFGEADENGYFV